MSGRLLEQYTEDELRSLTEQYSTYTEIAAITDHTVIQVSNTFKQIGIKLNKGIAHCNKKKLNNPQDCHSQSDGYIYKVTNLVNGKCYIGQTINDPKYRWHEHICTSHNKSSNGYNYPLYRSIRKYGVDSFSFDVIEKCKRSVINERESYYIMLFDSFQNGYNQTLGGVGARRITIEEELEIVSNFKKGTTIHALAVLFQRTTSTIRNILLRCGITEEELLTRARNAIVRKVKQYDTNYNLIKTFDSLASVGEWLIDVGLSKCKNKTAAATQIKRRLAQSDTNYCEYAGYIWKAEFTKAELDDFLERNKQYRKNSAKNYDHQRNKEQYYDECPRCKDKKLIESQLCNNCRKQVRSQDFSKIPVTRSELKELIRTKTFAQIGRLFGVTDTSVRKWCKRFNLPYRIREIKSFTDKEWEKI